MTQLPTTATPAWEWSASGPGHPPDEVFVIGAYNDSKMGLGCKAGIEVRGGSPRRKPRQVKITWWTNLTRFTGLKRAGSVAEAVAALQASSGLLMPPEQVAALEAHVATLCPPAPPGDSPRRAELNTAIAEHLAALVPPYHGRAAELHLIGAVSRTDHEAAFLANVAVVGLRGPSIGRIRRAVRALLPRREWT